MCIRDRISAGEYSEHQYSVSPKYIQKVKDTTDSYMIHLEGPNSFYLEVGSQKYRGISVGDNYLAKHVNGRVWIDEFDEGPCTGKGKWFLLGLGGFIGLVPITMGACEIYKASD